MKTNRLMTNHNNGIPKRGNERWFSITTIAESTTKNTGASECSEDYSKLRKLILLKASQDELVPGSDS